MELAVPRVSAGLESQGEDGPQGPAGDSGGDGVQGAQVPGQDADPADVVPRHRRADSTPPADFPYVNKLQNDTKRGSLTMDGGQLVMESRGVTNAIDVKNNNIVNAVESPLTTRCQ